MVNRIKKWFQMPNWSITTFFNWTLNFRNQAYDEMLAAGHDVTNYDRSNLMDSEYDDSDLCRRADDKIKHSRWIAQEKLAFSIT
jgi:isocitrate lyase